MKHKAYPLDNSAILHLAVNRRHNSNFFRLTLEMTEPVDPDLLQEALDMVAPRFPTIAARIRSGFFRHQVIPLDRAPRVRQDDGLLRTATAAQLEKGGLRVLYSGHQIFVEIFHSLTDGYGGWHFMKAMAGQYLRLRYGVAAEQSEDLITPETPVHHGEWEDGFLRHAGREKAALQHVPSYQIQPNGGQTREVHTTTLSLPVQPLLQTARDYQVTITTLLTTVLAASIMELQKQQRPGKALKPVQVMVPVDLRRQFPSKSLRNFSLYALPQLRPGEEHLKLEHLLEKIRSQLDSQFSSRKLRAMMTTNTLMDRNWLLSRIPLALKCTGIRLAYKFFGAMNSSISLSNLGQLRVPEALQPYIRRADVLLMPRIYGPYNCGAISYGGQLRISFSRCCAQPELERIFVRRLRELGHQPQVELDGRPVGELG